MRVAAVQMRSGTDPFENLLFVNDCVLDAADRGCELVCFPENVFYRGPRTADGFERSNFFLSLDRDGRLETSDLDFAASVREFVQSWKIPVSLGSVFELDLATGKVYNSHWLVIPDARVRAYRKVHLFDYTTGPVQYRESQDFAAGDQPLALPLGGEGFTLGLSICFDLRFPELYRDLVLNQGANVLLIPAAFTLETGKAHWDTLLKARAVENFSFVIAAAQWGAHHNAKGQELFCYGRSQVLDPWGEVLAETGIEGDALIVADLDVERLKQVRRALPALDCVRLFK